MKTALIAAIALCAIAGAAEGQVQGPPGGRGFQMPPNPIAVLLENRAELGLTDDQFTQIDAIRATLEEENAPHMATLDSLRSGGAGADPAARGRMRPTMQAIRANQDAAVASAMELLTEDQRPRAQALVDAARPQRPGGRSPRQ